MFGGVDVGPECDAAYWSTGAIEQFLLPYYASIDGFAGLEDLQALRKSWTENRPFVGGNRLEDGQEVPFLGPEREGTEVVGILHIWPSMIESDEESNPTLLRKEITVLHAARGESRASRVRERREEAAGAA
jgi:hypothetical protein